MFPFHTWLPDAHVEAPTAGSVILAGVLLKMGTYGFVRFSLPFFPAVVSHPKVQSWMIGLSLVGIIYGALVSLMQKDMKKLVAYSSVSHLGFCTLGIFALNSMGLSGSVLQQINHGISTGALFLIVGILYERRHTREIAEYGGISNVMPHLRDHHHDHVSLVDGIAAAEWICRRVHDSAGSIHRELEMGGVGGAGRGSGRGLFALALSARLLRDGDESEERKAARSDAARNSYVCAVDRHGVMDRRFIPSRFSRSSNSRSIRLCRRFMIIQRERAGECAGCARGGSAGARCCCAENRETEGRQTESRRTERRQTNVVKPKASN